MKRNAVFVGLYIGVMNPADGPAGGPTYFSGAQGNAFPMYGTGHVVYSQFGYLLNKGLLGKGNGALTRNAGRKSQYVLQYQFFL